VPDREVRRPEPEGNAWAEQRAQRGADALAAGERREDRRGEEEHEQRPAQRGHHERRAEVADEDVLAHVRGEELVVGDAVERADEREDAHAEPGGEESDPVPAGELRAAATTQPRHRLCEQQRSDDGGKERNHVVIVPRTGIGRSGHVSVSDTRTWPQRTVGVENPLSDSATTRGGSMQWRRFGHVWVSVTRTWLGGTGQSPRWRAMTMRCTSFVPSPISRIFWSR